MRAPVRTKTSDYVKLEIFLITFDLKTNYQHQHISSIIRLDVLLNNIQLSRLYGKECNKKHLELVIL